MNKSRRESLDRLRALVNDLSDRDDQLKKDTRLFEEFFESFPLPVTIWSISLSGTVLSKRGNGFMRLSADNLDDLFLCPVIKEISIPKHELALTGEKVDYLARSLDHLFYIKLLPRHDENQKICGVTGISWDISDNMTMLSCLEDIFEQTKGSSGACKEINEKSSKALKSSRLKKLLAEIEK